MQFVLTAEGVTYNTEQVLTLLTNDFDNAPVYTARLDNQGAFNKANYVVDQTCASLTYIGSIVQTLHEWAVKVREGDVPNNNDIPLADLGEFLKPLDLGVGFGDYMMELLDRLDEAWAIDPVRSTML